MLQLHNFPAQTENNATAYVLCAFVIAHMIFAFATAGQCNGREKDNVLSPRAAWNRGGCCRLTKYAGQLQRGKTVPLVHLSTDLFLDFFELLIVG